MSPRRHGRIVQPLSGDDGSSRQVGHVCSATGGEACTAGAQQRGQSILDVTLKTTKLLSMSSKSLPSKMTVIGYLQTQTNEHTPTHWKRRAHKHTLAQMHTRSRTSGQEGHSHMRRWVQRHRGDGSKGYQRRKHQSDDHRPAANVKQSSG